MTCPHESLDTPVLSLTVYSDWTAHLACNKERVPPDQIGRLLKALGAAMDNDPGAGVAVVFHSDR